MGEYAIPPGARTLFDWIALTTSFAVKPKPESFCGSTSTSSAGVTVPLAVTLETPVTCSSAGTIVFVTIAERSAMLSDCEVTESVVIVACAGSNVRTVGAGKSEGSAARAVCTRSWTSVRSVVLFESSVKNVLIVAWFCWIDVLMWSMLGAPAIASSIGRTTESRSSDGGAPGYDALTETTGKSMLGVFCCTSVASAKQPASTTTATNTNTSGGRLTNSCVRRMATLEPRIDRP